MPKTDGNKLFDVKVEGTEFAKLTDVLKEQFQDIEIEFIREPEVTSSKKSSASDSESDSDSDSESEEKPKRKKSNCPFGKTEIRH